MLVPDIEVGGLALNICWKYATTNPLPHFTLLTSSGRVTQRIKWLADGWGLVYETRYIELECREVITQTQLGSADVPQSSQTHRINCLLS